MVWEGRRREAPPYPEKAPPYPDLRPVPAIRSPGLKVRGGRTEPPDAEIATTAHDREGVNSPGMPRAAQNVPDGSDTLRASL